MVLYHAHCRFTAHALECGRIIPVAGPEDAETMSIAEWKKNVLNGEWAWLHGMVLAWFAAYSGVGILRHYSFLSGYDLAFFAQYVWNTSHGRILEGSIYQPYLLGVHFSPVIVFIAPLMWVCASAAVLLVVQAGCLAIGGYASFLIGRDIARLTPRTSLVFALLYLLYRPVLNVNMVGFHAVCLATAPLMFAFWALHVKRWRVFWASVTFAALCKETVFLCLVPLGFYTWFVTRRRSFVALSAVAALCFVVIMYWLIPSLSATGDFRFYGRYGDLGGSPSAILTSCLTHPFSVVSTMFTADKVDFLKLLLRPLLFMSLLSPLVLSMAGPIILLILLSNYGPMYSIRFHYTATITPWVMAAGILGYAKANAWVRSLGGRKLGTALVAAITFACIGTAGLPGAVSVVNWFPTEEAANIRAVLRHIPADAAVSAQGNIIPHVCMRRHVKLFPGTQGCEWIIVDVEMEPGNVAPKQLLQYKARLDLSPDWTLVQRRGGCYLYRRVGPLRL